MLRNVSLWLMFCKLWNVFRTSSTLSRSWTETWGRISWGCLPFTSQKNISTDWCVSAALHLLLLAECHCMFDGLKFCLRWKVDKFLIMLLIPNRFSPWCYKVTIIELWPLTRFVFDFCSALLIEAHSMPFQVQPSTMANVVKGLYSLRPGELF